MENMIDVKGLDLGTDTTRVISMHTQSLINTETRMTWSQDKNH